MCTVPQFLALWGLSKHLPLAPSVKDDVVFINFSVKIRFKFILFRELEESFMAPLKIPPGVSLGCHQSKARMAERKAERQ